MSRIGVNGRVVVGWGAAWRGVLYNDHELLNTIGIGVMTLLVSALATAIFVALLVVGSRLLGWVIGALLAPLEALLARAWRVFFKGPPPAIPRFVNSGSEWLQRVGPRALPARGHAPGKARWLGRLPWARRSGRSATGRD